MTGGAIKRSTLKPWQLLRYLHSIVRSSLVIPHLFGLLSHWGRWVDDEDHPYQGPQMPMTFAKLPDFRKFRKLFHTYRQSCECGWGLEYPS